MTRPALIAAFSILALTTACRPRDAAPEKTEVPAAVSTTQAEALDPKTLAGLAFGVAWGAPSPVRRKIDAPGVGATEITYTAGRLVPLGGDRYALISDGKGGGAHVEAGALAIHYLKRTPSGFERTGAWPEFTFGGTFGAPPDWIVRTDLTAAPAIVTTGGGTWQGYTCAVSDVIELAPDRPWVRAQSIPVHYDSSGAALDSKDAQTMEGAIGPGEKGRDFLVRYTGARTATVAYQRSGETYAPTSAPDLLTC